MMPILPLLNASACESSPSRNALKANFEGGLGTAGLTPRRKALLLENGGIGGRAFAEIPNSGDLQSSTVFPGSVPGLQGKHFDRPGSVQEPT